MQPLNVVLTALLLAGCSSGPAATPEPTDTPTPTIETTSIDTPTPWPSAFAEHFCVALAESDIVTEDLGALSDAATRGDLEALSLHANSVAADIETMDVAVSQAPPWPPAAAAVKKLRAALAAFGPATADVIAGADTANAAKITRGSKRLGVASELITTAGVAVDAMAAATGFHC